MSAAQLPAILIACALNSSVNGGAGSTPTVTGTGMTQISAAWFADGANTTSFAYQLITTPGNYQGVFNQASNTNEDIACGAIILYGVTAPMFASIAWING